MTARMYYKALGPDGESIYGKGSWDLPRGKTPGRWEQAVGKLVVCKNGIHLCRRNDLIEWLGPRIFEAEAGGDEPMESDNKIVVRRARLIREFKTWNERIARLFAADCAEHVLSIFEAWCPDDARPRRAIEAARQYARGEITRSAACSVSDAAYAATNVDYMASEVDSANAAYAAFLAAEAADSASDATTNAAYAAARAAARLASYAAACFAARSATDPEARIWQTNRLFDYLEGRVA